MNLASNSEAEKPDLSLMGLDIGLASWVLASASWVLALASAS